MVMVVLRGVFICVIVVLCDVMCESGVGSCIDWVCVVVVVNYL